MEKIIVGNWKMNLSFDQAYQFVDEMKRGLANQKKSHQIILAPSYVLIHPLSERMDSLDVDLAAQNCAAFDQGAYTGEVSASMIQQSGAKYVILGHSERRCLLGESSQQIEQKIQQALKVGLKPIVCVGEDFEKRQDGKAHQWVYHQMHEAIRPYVNSGHDHVILAYEPVWAIGTGQVASLEHVADMHAAMQSYVKKYFSQIKISILYGGSVGPDNVKNLLKHQLVDGVLVGGASLNAQKFLSLIF